MWIRRCAVALAIAWVTGLGALAQDSAQEVERLFQAALHGRIVIRPQAADQLVALGEEGEQRILRELQEGGLGLARLGPPIIEAMGGAASLTLRGALWPALLDSDFPWRPSVARALAQKPRGGESPSFQQHLGDPLAEVRAAMAMGMGLAKGPLAALQRSLRDEDSRVRQAAALALLDRGEQQAFWYLLEELRREDQFFERPTGTSARITVSRALIKRGVDLEGFDCRLSSTNPANAKALRTLADSLTTKTPVFAPWQTASGPISGEQIGLELRSCRAGEFFLRWTHDDRLLVGQGNPAVVALPPGTTQRLVQHLAAAYDNLDGARFFGTAGCDLEQVLLRRSVDSRSQTLVIAKGPEPVPNLRPKALSQAYAPLIGTLPDHESSDPRLHHLLRRTRAALAVLGGALTD